MNERVLRVALAIGGAVDLFVALLALFFQPLLGPLLDVPVKDPALTTIAGGEFLVAACIYATAMRDAARTPMLLWICVLDQVFAVALPGIEVARGHIAATWKILAPMPLNLALAAIYAWGARRVRRSAPR